MFRYSSYNTVHLYFEISCSYSCLRLIVTGALLSHPKSRLLYKASKISLIYGVSFNLINSQLLPLVGAECSVEIKTD